MRPAQERARLSAGASEAAVHRMACRALAERGASGVLADVGCGRGDLWRALEGRFSRCLGVDAVRYEGLPEAVVFHAADLDAPLPLPDACADAVAALETIEHLENPRAFLRELVRIVRPGGWVLVSTPNQRSLLSLLTLVVKGRFSAFQDVHYPAHLTALLETDLLRMAGECRLDGAEIAYSLEGRVPGTPLHYPRGLSGAFPRALSDNLMLIGRKETSASNILS